MGNRANKLPPPSREQVVLGLGHLPRDLLDLVAEYMPRTTLEKLAYLLDDCDTHRLKTKRTWYEASIAIVFREDPAIADELLNHYVRPGQTDSRLPLADVLRGGDYTVCVALCAVDPWTYWLPSIAITLRELAEGIERRDTDYPGKWYRRALVELIEAQ